MAAHPPADAPDPMQRGQWQQSTSLRALRTVLNTAPHLNQVVAHRAGMSVSELLALTHLSGEALGPAEIARRLSVTTAASSGIVDKLATRGYLERRPDPDDRRRTRLVISEEGRRAVIGQLVPMFVALARVDAALDDAERAVVTRYLDDVLDAMGEVVGRGGWPYAGQARPDGG